MSSRLASEQGFSPENFQNTREPRDRSNGHIQLFSGSEIHVCNQGRSCRSNRHPDSGLEQIHSSLCVPSTSHDRTNPQQDLTIQQNVQLYNDISLASQSHLVSQDLGISHSTSIETACQPQDCSQPSGILLHSKKTLWETDKVRRLDAFWLGGLKLDNCPLGLSKLYSRAGRKQLKKAMDWATDTTLSIAGEMVWTKLSRVR